MKTGNSMGLAENILNVFADKGQFTLEEAYQAVPEKPKTTVRARIYENLGIRFKRIGKGVYSAIQGTKQCILIEGDGRDLSMLKDESIDCIITDHPWDDSASNKGGNRSFADYECFSYGVGDFREKARVLKPGCFLAEFLPAENANNFEYLYQVKKMAESCGFMYYCKVPWKKGNFISNTGRKAKNSQDIMIFTKGKARDLRLDAKRTKAEGSLCYMSGAAGMLPAVFDVEPVPRKQKTHQSELPVELCGKLLEYLTRSGEIILDQFAGSGAVGAAALEKGRRCILIEKKHEYAEQIRRRLEGEPPTAAA